MRIAHLILVHQGPAQLARLLQRLAHPQATCFVHLDAKADFADFAHLAGQPGVMFTRARLSVRWGGYSLTEAALAGLAEMLAHPGPAFTYFNVLSGQDYPLRPAADIHRFFEQHPGISFMEYDAPDSPWWQANRSRAEQYHLTEYSFPGRYGVQRLLNAVLPRRRFPLPGYELYGGRMGGWYTLSHECARYVVDFVAARPALRRFARLTWGSDEFLLHTILLNSPLRALIVNNNLRYIDWSGGGASPRTFTLADLPALLATDRLWARKFDPRHDAAVLDALDERVLGVTPAAPAASAPGSLSS
ncbi:beta-1,6-N-acetylglucosaminyltransferase [Hymenobacter canadensis]|uniref:Peptide O-xylosyltransferase n=1 Tax=Hymenobacter canadensis TaxID=2999067 RepID=A0ABY7LYZ3_9BACT|nr:beta-1,6-N-acetylglucosaminyltransferase [Hymenobacter canadensis]WBA44168.1 glycosyl transferase [Hymenobacter canadensis]